jgi:hypothetical protein
MLLTSRTSHSQASRLSFEIVVDTHEMAPTLAHSTRAILFKLAGVLRDVAKHWV